jgi:hypothetical protein
MQWRIKLKDSYGVTNNSCIFVFTKTFIFLLKVPIKNFT